MFAWARILISIATGLVAYLFLHDVYLSGLVAIIYFIPLTSGWGTWDCIATDREAIKPNPYSEGWLGVQQIAEWVYPSDKDWLTHCRIALLVDGIFRALWVLIFAFFIDIYIVIPCFIVLSCAFLLASELGYYTSKLWNFKYMTGGWEHQEVIYGVLQDLVLIGVVVWKLMS
jgi:hypothetical protein